MAVVDLSDLELFKNDFCLLPDFFDFFCGGQIGKGNSRVVYECRSLVDYVIKIEFNHTERAFSNISEHDIYWNVKHHHKEWAKFLAPILRISSCGKVMLQQRTKPLDNKTFQKKMPQYIPSFLADTKKENWGTINGRIVCHDYANHHFIRNANKKLVKAKWWSENFQAL